MNQVSSNKGYKKLKVWQEAHKLTVMVYKETRKFPKEELFSLTNQIRRAAVSVPANIVEGQARGSKKLFRQFLNIANGSLVEVEYYLELSKELSYLTGRQFDELDQQRLLVGRMLNGLAKSVRKNLET